MFEKYLEKLIKQKLGAFIEGLDQNNFSFGVSVFKLIYLIGFQCKFESGECEAEIKIPWLKIGSQPIEVIVDGLNLIVTPQKKNLWQVIDIFDQEALEQKVFKIANDQLFELQKTENKGYFEKLALKVLDNIQIKVKGVHFRLEDHFSGDTSYTFGIVMKSLDIHTTNQNWEPSYIDRGVNNANLYKILKIDEFGFYLNPNDSFIIHQQTENQAHQVQMMDSVIGLQEHLSKTNNLTSNINYVLNPMNLRLNMEYKTHPNKKLDVSINLEKYQLSLQKSQLKCFISFFELASQYHSFQNDLSKCKKFKFLRPLSEKIVPTQARQWWRYAYECIKRSNLSRKGSMREFNIPLAQLKMYREEFSKLFKHLWKNRDNKKAWSKEDYVIWRQILISLDDKTLTAWILDCIKSLDKKAVSKAAKEAKQLQKEKGAQAAAANKETETKKKGFTSWLFNKTSTNDASKNNTANTNSKEQQNDTILQEEIKELENELEQSAFFADVSSNETSFFMVMVINESAVEIGEVNSQNVYEGIILFSRNIQISFKKFESNEGQFEIETSIQDYGVDLFSFNRSSQLMMDRESVIMSNKRLFPMSQEEQFKLRLRKQPSDLKNVDFDIEMISNPLAIVYSKEFLKRIISISKVKVAQETQYAAIDRIGDWREATSNQIYQIIYKKSNRFSINIASPVLILPLSADSNPKSPVWVVRLGDIGIVSEEQKEQSSSVIEYEYYSMHIESMRLQYYTSFDKWLSKIQYLSNLREKTMTQQTASAEVFSVVEDCWLKINMGIKQKKAGQIMLGQEQYKEHQKKPKVLLNGQSSNISINLCPTIYNSLVNLNKIFDLEGDKKGGIGGSNEEDQEQIQSKREVAQNAIKIGSLKKRLDPVKQWENFFCMLSGGYLYFYKDSKQLMPSTYYYLKGAQVEENKSELGLDHNLFIWGRFGECCLSFGEEIIMKDWAKLIRTRIYDLSAENGAQIEEEQVQVQKKAKKNYENIQMEVNFKIPGFNVLILNEPELTRDCTNQAQCIEWVQLQFTRMAVKQITRRADTSFNFEMSEIKLNDKTLPVNSNLISQSNRVQKGTYDYHSNLALDLNIFTTKKESPLYNNVDTEIGMKMSNIDMKFQPFTINKILKFFNNTRFKGFPGQDQHNRESSSSQMYRSLIEDESSEANKSNQKQPQEAGCTCSQVRETLVKFTCEVYSISAGLLHQQYNMEIFRLDADYLKITYVQSYDHMNFEIALKDISLYDLTGYPYTHDPKAFHRDPNSLKQNRNLIMAVDSKDLNNGLLFQYQGYDSPTCPKKKVGYGAKIFLSIRPLKLNYVQEVVMRFYSYFFDQFLEAIMTTDPYKDPRNEIEKQKKRKTLKSDHIKTVDDFQQVKEIMDMHIQIGDVNILLQDRFHSKEYVSLSVQEINIHEELASRTKRIPTKPQHPLFVNIFKLDLKNIMLKYGVTNNDINAPITHGFIGGKTQNQKGKQLCKAPFNLLVDFEKLAFSPLFEKVDMHDLEQYIQIDLDFEPIELLLPQDIYTYILRCLDLNINYQDNFQEEFFFINYTNLQEYTKLLKDVIGMKINLTFLSLSLLMQHMDGSFLSELLLNNMQFNMIKYMDYDKKMNLSCEQFYILEQESRLKVKQVQSMSPMNSKKEQNMKAYKMDDLLSLQQYQEELFKEIVISPLNSLQFLSEKQLQPHKKRLNNPLMKIGANQLVVQMDTLPNGDKFIRVNISGLKIIVKPHIFLMVYYFFLNSFPVYDLNSLDKPNFFNTDPEDSAKMDFELSIEDSLICLQNKPGYKTVACEGRIFFKFKSDRVKDKKTKFEEESKLVINDDEDDRSQNEVSEETKLIWLMEVRVNDLCPFVCSMGQLNGIKDFQKIKKRQLLSPFEVYYSSRLDLCLFTPQNHAELILRASEEQQAEMFGVDSFSEIFIERVKMKLSIQDMHLIFQILSYASENVTSEYFKKIESIEAYMKDMKQQQQVHSPLSSQEKLSESPMMNAGKRSFMQGRSYTKTSMSKENFMKQRTGSNEVEQEDMEQNFDELFEDLKKNQGEFEKNSMASQFSRLRNTTMAFSKIADKYTSVYNRGSQLKNIVVKNLFKDQVFELQVNEEEDEKLEESLTGSKQSILQAEGEIDEQESEESKASTHSKEVKRFFNGENKASNKRTFTVDNIMVEETKSLNPGDDRSKRKLSNSSQNNQRNLQVKSKMNSTQNSQMQRKLETGGISSDNYEDARSDLFYSANSKMKSQINQQFNNQNNSSGDDVQSKGSRKSKNNKVKQEAKNSDEPIPSVFDHVQKTKISFESGGLQILFINDFDQVFCPVLDLDIPDIQFRQTNESEENQMIEFEIQKCKIFYFNAKIGDWEPFIENFQVKCLLNSVKNQKFVKVEFNKQIIINITESCLQNLIESYNSWMATPPFEMDEININGVGGSQLSINDDEQDSDCRRESGERSKSLANDIYNEVNDIDQVTPYTIKNLTHLKLNIINGSLNGRQSGKAPEYIEGGNTSWDRVGNQENNESTLRTSDFVAHVPSKRYKLKPGEECQYAVEYDQQTQFLHDKSKKKKGLKDVSEFVPFGATPGTNLKDSKIALKTRHQELVSILFQSATYEPITNVDLNEIVSNHCILKVPLPKPQQPSSDEDNYSVQLTPYDTRSKSKSTSKKNQDLENMIQSIDQKYIVYGVTMYKMRKILTIRTPFALYNKTLFDYQIKFTERSNGQVREEFTLKPDKKYPINFKYYQDCDLAIKIVESALKNENEVESNHTSKRSHQSKDLYSDNYSQKCFIDQLMALPIDTGSMVVHNNGKHTFIKKQTTELKDAYDLTLLPPVVVKNALPCEISILGNQSFQEGKVQHSDYEGEEFHFEKGDEKYFHIFTYNGESRDEILLKFRVSGYCWTQVSLKPQSKKDRKTKKFSDKTSELDIECKDVNGSSVQIGVRVQTINAYYYVTFFAHTCIINHSLFKMKFHYDQINKPLLGGQDNNRDFILANKDQALIASLFDKSISKPIKIKTAGLKDEFSIISVVGQKGQYENLNSERKHSKHLSNNDNENNSQAYQRQKKHDFVFTTYLSLAIEDDFIYTKIVQISPKYVIVNKMKSQICISQEGCQDQFSETLNPKERREWVWPNAGQPEFMVVKRPNFNPEMMYLDDHVNTSLAQVSESGKKKAWHWSSSFTISDLGLMSLQIRRKGARVNTEKTRKIIRVVKKLVDATIFVIFEDENQENPYYKIENACEHLVIDCVQKGFDMRTEGCELLPKSEISFAFIDCKMEHILVCDIGNMRDSMISDEDRDHQQRLLDDIIVQKEYDFETMISKDIILPYTSALTGKQKNLYINIYTNGCTKILRFSDKSLKQEQLDVESKQYREKGLLNGQDMKTTIEVSLKELSFSIVSPVATKNKKKQIVSKRKEIAFITISNFGFTQITSNKQQFTSIKVGVFQIDNQSNANALFPTIFQQSITKNEDQRQFLDVNIILKVGKPEVTYVDDLDVTISGMIVKLDDEFLGYALNFAFDLLEMMKTNFTGIHPIFMPPQDEQQQLQQEQYGFGNDRITFFGNRGNFPAKKNNMPQRQTAEFREDKFGVVSPPNKNHQKSVKKKGKKSKGKSIKSRPMNHLQIEEELKEEIKEAEKQDQDKQESKFQSWLNKKLDDDSNRLYINKCKMSVLEIEVSFLARKKFQLGEKEDTYQLRKYMNSSGLALINVDEAPISLSAIPLHQVFGDSGNFSAMIIDHYTQGIKNNLFKLVGSTSLLGNPSKFTRIMGQGFKDLVNEPRNGPVLYGLAKGSGSLVKNTVEGTFGFMQSISEGFSKGLLLLSMDKDYLCKREEKLITEKPKNFVEGVGYGCQTTINSVISGCAGLVVRPYKEVKRDGISGVPLGMWSGVGGFVLKPMSGGLDLFAKTAEGIKNTAKIFESKVFKDRQRLPRPFYGNQQQIKFYSDSDAYIVMRILNTIKERIFRKDHYIETVKFEEQDRTLFLIITEEHLILLEAAQKSVWWHIQSDFIQMVEKYENGLIFKLKQKMEGRRQVAIEINNPANIERVYEKVKIYAEAGGTEIS